MFAVVTITMVCMHREFSQNLGFSLLTEFLNNPFLGYWCLLLGLYFILAQL